MKAWLSWSVPLLGLLLFQPSDADGQLQNCEKCNEYVFEEEGSYVVKHQFPEEPEGVLKWCDAYTDDTAEEQIATGPAEDDGDCDSCHPEWLRGMCLFHESCGTEDETVQVILRAEVDRLVSAMESGEHRTIAEPARELSALLSRLLTFFVDRDGGKLILDNCQGRLISEWPVSKLTLDPLARL